MSARRGSRASTPTASESGEPQMAQLLEAVAGLGEQVQGMAQEIIQMKTQQARAAEAAAAE